jgi:hypothetical protein
MKIKKGCFFLFLCALAVSFLMAGCGGKYADAKKVNKEYIELAKKYIADLNEVESAKDAAKAMNRFADGMEGLWPKMKALSEKYPELRDRNNPPEELKGIQTEAQEIGKKMGASMMKIMPYMKDPEVQQAQKRLQEVMMKQ